jgi:hypothetical protein
LTRDDKIGIGVGAGVLFLILLFIIIGAALTVNRKKAQEQARRAAALAHAARYGKGAGLGTSAGPGTERSIQERLTDVMARINAKLSDSWVDPSAAAVGAPPFNQRLSALLDRLDAKLGTPPPRPEDAVPAADPSHVTLDIDGAASGTRAQPSYAADARAFNAVSLATGATSVGLADHERPPVSDPEVVARLSHRMARIARKIEWAIAGHENASKPIEELERLLDAEPDLPPPPLRERDKSMATVLQSANRAGNNLRFIVRRAPMH